MNLNPNFPNRITYFSLLYLHSCNFIVHDKLYNKLLYIVFYLVNIILENSIVPYEFDIRPFVQIYYF